MSGEREREREREREKGKEKMYDLKRKTKLNQISSFSMLLNFYILFFSYLHCCLSQ